MMDYPALTESQVARRWKLSTKTLRRWRASGHGPRWHKLFNLVRYHVADLVEFESKVAQFWTNLFQDGERVSKAAPRSPTEAPLLAEEANAESFYLTIKDILGPTGLPGYWFRDQNIRARKRIPHLALVNNVRFSLEAIWEWEVANSIMGAPPAPASPPEQPTQPEPPGPVPRWYEMVREIDLNSRASIIDAPITH